MKNSIWIALALVLGLAIWMGSGMMASEKPDNEKQTEQTPDKAENFVSVKMQTFEAKPLTREVRIQGYLKPVKSAQISAETNGAIEKLHIEKGQQVTTDTILFELSQNARQADLRRVEASMAQRKLEVDAAKSLLKKGLQSENQLKQAQAALSSARAERDAIRLDIENTLVKSPFDGVINQLHIELGEYATAGSPVATLVDNSSLLMNGDIPQTSIADVRNGMPAQIILADGRDIKGEVSYVSVEANDATRSFGVDVKIPNGDNTVSAGISAEAIIPVEEVMAQFIPTSAIVLESDGSLSVKSTNTENQVISLPITILENNNEGVWVTGLNESVQLITQGQGFVVNGETVNTTNEQSDSTSPNT